MFLRRRLAALALLYCLLPGAGELIENTSHVVRYGHLAHSIRADHFHRPAADPEHGCTTTVHFCSCHASTSFLPPAASALGAPDPHPRDSEPARLRPLAGAIADVFRPPRLA